MPANNKDWTKAPPLFRRFLIFIGFVSTIGLLFFIVIKNYFITTAAASVLITWFGVIGTMLGIYTYKRGKQDDNVISESMKSTYKSFIDKDVDDYDTKQTPK